MVDIKIFKAILESCEKINIADVKNGDILFIKDKRHNDESYISWKIVNTFKISKNRKFIKFDSCFHSTVFSIDGIVRSVSFKKNEYREPLVYDSCFLHILRLTDSAKLLMEMEGIEYDQ